MCKNGVFKRLFDRNFYFMAKKHAGCAKCACAADATSEMQVRPTPATAPQMVPRRYRGRRTCRTARKRRCSGRFQLQATKIPQTAPFYLCAPDFKNFREIMMATGPRAARVRTSAGESVGCIGLAPTGLLPSSFAHVQAIQGAKCSPTPKVT